MVDYLYVGYDNIEGDIPNLIVARKTKCLGLRISNTEILKQFSGQTAVDVYNFLTISKEKHDVK